MRIGQLATETGVTAKTIRFYEQEGLLPEPPRSGNGYRDYPPQARDRLAFIRDAQAAGLTLAEIRGVLAIRDTGHPPCRHVTDLVQAHLAQVNVRITELLQTRAALEELHHRAKNTDPAHCAPDGVCMILTAQSP